MLLPPELFHFPDVCFIVPCYHLIYVCVFVRIGFSIASL